MSERDRLPVRMLFCGTATTFTDFYDPFTQAGTEPLRHAYIRPLEVPARCDGVTCHFIGIAVDKEEGCAYFSSIDNARTTLEILGGYVTHLVH